MRTLRRPGAAIGLLLAVVAVAGLVFAATRAPGPQAARATTNDGGAWLLHRGAGQIGHMNRLVREVTGAVRVAEPRAAFDVDQAPGMIAVHNAATNQVSVIDDRSYQVLNSTVVPPGVSVRAYPDGVVISRSRPLSVWRLDRQALTEAADLDRFAPLHRSEGGGLVAVALDGTVAAYDRAADELVVELDGRRRIVAAPTGGAGDHEPVAITFVGGTAVLLGADGALWRIDTGADALTPRAITTTGAIPAPDGIRLQQAGEPAGTVTLIEAGGQLRTVAFDGGAVNAATVAGRGHLEPIAFRGCTYALATEPPTLTRRCGDRAVSHELAGAGPALRLRLVNGWVWVNDVDDGTGWVLAEDDQLDRIDDWGQALAEQQDQVDETIRTPDGKVIEQRDADAADAALDNADELDEDGRNDPPIARDDEAATRIERPQRIEVLRNDEDPDGDVMLVTEVQNLTPEAAGLSITPARDAVQVDPVAGFSGTVRFRYSISDGRGGTASAEVTVQVRPADVATNRPPEPQTDVAATRSGEPVALNVLDNDRDPDGDALVLVGVDAGDSAAAGSVRFVPEGQVTFTPDPLGTAAEITLTYTVADDFGDTAQGTIRVAVRLDDANQAPDARNDSIATAAGRPVVLQLLANDTDPDGDPLLVTGTPLLVQPAGATVDAAASPDGTFFFTPPAAGTWLFTYSVSDGAGTDVAQIRVDASDAPTNRPPVAVRDDAVIPVGGTRMVYALDNDGDPDGDVVAIVDWLPADGLDVEEIEGLGFRVTVKPGAPARAQFRYSISDGVAEPVSTVVVIAVTEVEALDQPPVTAPDVIEARPGRTTTVPVLVNDFDPEGGPLTLVGWSAPPEGVALAIDPTKRLLLVTVPVGRSATFTVAYDVADEAGNRNAAEVQVRVIDPAEPNRPPIARPDEARTRNDRDLVVAVLDNDSDPDGDPIRVEAIGAQPDAGSVEVLADGTVRYVPLEGATGTDRFTYVVVDALGERSLGEVRIGVMPKPAVNRPPDARDDRIAVLAGSEPAALDLLGNDIDPDGDELTITEASDVRLGTVSPAADGRSVVFEAPAALDADTEVAFRYRIDDGNGGTDDAVVTVLLQRAAAPVAPVAVDDQAGPARPGDLVTVDVLANDSDPDGRLADLTLSSADPAATVVGRSLRITAGDATRAVPYRITDADGLSASATVTVVVVDNQAPVLRPLEVETPFGQELTLDLAGQATDPDGDRLFFACCEGARGGAALIGAAGQDQLRVTFRPDDGFSGQAAFSYTVDDQRGHQVAGSVRITVLPEANRAPVATDGGVEVEAGSTASIDLGRFLRDDDPGDALTFDIEALDGELRVERRGADAATVTAASGATGRTATVRATATDRAGAAATATITVTVTPTSRPRPVAQADRASTDQGRPVTVAVLVNDVGDGLRVVAAAASGGGQVAVTADEQQVVFSPAADFYGQASFTYTITDEFGTADRQVSAQAVVDVTGRPATPAAPQATADSTLATLVWVSPAGNGAPITGYELEHDGGGRASVGNVNSHAWTGLTNGTAYRFRIRAQNRAGWSDWSALSPAVTPDTLPGRPAAPTVRFADGALDVAWTAPANDGSAITGYVLEIGGARSAVQELGDVTGYRWTALTNGQSYQFRVKARNAKGDGDFSAWSTGERPLREPDAPASVTVTRGSRVLDVTWSRPANNGDPIIEYEVQLQSSGASARVAGESTLTYRWSDLTNGVDQSFRVRARNRDADWGAWSGYSAAVKPCGVPDAPAAPAVTPGDRAAVLSWSPPSDQGCAITNYELRASTGGTQNATASPHTFTGLANGAPVSFTIVAVNEVGRSAAGPASTAVTPSGPPAATAITSATSGIREVDLAWAPAADNGSPITSYQVSVDGAWRDVGNRTATTVAGLQDQQTYSFAVRAVNANGPGAASPAVNGRTFGVPAQMGAPSLSAPSPTQVDVGWTAPASDQPITSYEVHMENVAFRTVGGLSTSYTGLNGDTAYRVQVRACSAVGCGPYGAFATVTTPPARFITLAKGGSAQGESGCVSARCAFMVVTASAGINPNAIVRCYSTDFGDFGVTITFSRYNQVNNTCYYGGFGRAWIEADGVRSNEVPW